MELGVLQVFKLSFVPVGAGADLCQAKFRLNNSWSQLSWPAFTNILTKEYYLRFGCLPVSN